MSLRETSRAESTASDAPGAIPGRASRPRATRPAAAPASAAIAAASLALAIATDALVAHADAKAASPTPSASASAGAAHPLPELPRLPPIALPEPDPSAQAELDRLLERLVAPDARTRDAARAAIAEATPGLVPAIHHRMQEIRASLDRDAAPRRLDEARRAGRKMLRAKAKEKNAEGEGAKPSTKARGESADDEGDWLEFVHAKPAPNDKTWRDLVHLLAMEHMLAAVGTTPAVRELISMHAWFGEMFRIDLQRQIAKLRDRAVPALIEARQHDAKIVQRWANRQLDAMGRAIPGEAVSTNDTQVLADVLRAYGRTRDVDAARVILSFCNADQVHVREAAREAVAAIGDAGIWQLRDVYLNMTGTKPPREWTWDRIARELFATYDRARMAEVYELMDEGLAAAREKKLEAATAAFDKVLARAPLFDRRKEMVAAYVDRAAEIEADRPEDAVAMLRKALRLDPKGPRARKLEAHIAYLDGAILKERGTPERFLFERALELDPGHAGAREALASLEAREAPRKRDLRRYVAAAAVGLVAIVTALLLGRRRPAPGPSPSAMR